MLSIMRVGRSCAVGILALMALRAPASATTNPPDTLGVVTGPLSLSRALQLVNRYHPVVRVAGMRAEAIRARIRDANRLPNPGIAASKENFGGSTGSGRAESTIGLEQLLELGGDRKARTGVAEAESRVASADAAFIRREILAATAERFFAAWTLQSRILRLREGERLTQQAIEAANARFRAGASPVLERTRAESQALSQAVERRRTEAELWIARRELAAQWGEVQAAFDSLVLPTEEADRSAESRPFQVSSHPEQLRASAREAEAAARVHLAEAARIPDLTASGGVRRQEGVGGTAFVAALHLPLPFWNRGSGALTAARREREAAALDARGTERRLQIAMASALERLGSAAAVYDTLRLRVRPAQAQLIRELLQSYRAGRSSYLDLVAEQRNLLETDRALLEAQADLWRARVGLDLLTGAGVLPPAESEGKR